MSLKDDALKAFKNKTDNELIKTEKQRTKNKLFHMNLFKNLFNSIILINRDNLIHGKYFGIDNTNDYVVEYDEFLFGLLIRVSDFDYGHYELANNDCYDTKTKNYKLGVCIRNKSVNPQWPLSYYGEWTVIEDL